VVLAMAASSFAYADPSATATSVAPSESLARGEAINASLQVQLHQVELATTAKADALQASCIRHSVDLAPRLRQTASSALAALRTAANASDRSMIVVQLAQLDAASREASRLTKSVAACASARTVAAADANGATAAPDTTLLTTTPPPPATTPPPPPTERNQARLHARDRAFGRCTDLLGVIGCATIPLEYVGFASPHFP
jgi:hypothetical protein